LPFRRDAAALLTDKTGAFFCQAERLSGTKHELSGELARFATLDGWG
jgi:hypothetical protein